jgi:regulator of protease activity HflC (stomatin/prohibitin superfamily)
MIALKVVLMVAGVLLLASALEIPLYEVWIRFWSARRKAGADEETSQLAVAEAKKDIQWRRAAVLAVVGCVPLLLAEGIVVVPSGMGGVRVSQVRGTLPGTLYPGVHFITPMIDSVQTFDLRDHLFTAGMLEEGGKGGGEEGAERAVT